MHNGVAVALAWHETWCKQSGAWYDKLADLLYISKNHYYKVGHAAVVLIENKTQNCHYFDFGRYHAPLGYGRVRNAETDPELSVQTKAIFDKNGRLTNLKAILNELVNNPACHGTGAISGSFAAIDFEKAYQKAQEMQQKSPIIYGPFVPKGTNCSRFVQTVILAGNPSLKHLLKIRLPFTITPSPMHNVNSLHQKTVIYPANTYDKKPPNVVHLKNVLPAPSLPPNLSNQAKWLAGEGAGSWFDIMPTKKEQTYYIKRYSPDGVLECEGFFESNTFFDVHDAFKIGYLSHSKQITILQNNQIILLHRKK